MDDNALTPGTRVTYTQKLQAPDDFDGKTGVVVEVATRKIEGHTPVIYDHMPHLVAWPATEFLVPSVLPSVEDVSLALGDRVLFRRPLVRKRSRNERGRHGYDGLPVKMLIARRDWVRGEQEMWRPGIIIGKRTLQNGEYNYGGEDEQSYLSDIEYVPAYLIAYDLHQKPVRVLEDDIKPL